MLHTSSLKKCFPSLLSPETCSLNLSFRSPSLPWPSLASPLIPSHPPPAPEALEVGRLKSYLREVQKQPTVFCEACRKDSHERDSDCTHGHLVVLEGTMVLNLR